MVKHPASTRVHRDQDAEDAFLARVTEYAEWARRNSRAVIAIGVLLFVAVTALLYYRNYRQTLQEQASSALVEIRRTAASGNIQLAARDLERFVQDFGNTDAGREGRLLLAQVYLLSNQPGQALGALEGVSTDARRPQGAAAAFLRAAALEQAERTAEAEAAYLEIAERARMDFERRRALSHAARLRTNQGDPAGAAELYAQALELLPEDDPERGFFRMRLAEAEAAAGAAKAAGS